LYSDRSRKSAESPMWAHEIKRDGYRVQVSKRDRRVRLFTRRGFDWSDRHPRIIEAGSES
jgi:bifunctional non-homologous end joining protein LigD